ncbi:hypothetical protein Tco_1578254 [Tanacetum coccineum]
MSHVRVLSRAIGVSSRVRKGKGAIAFWAGPNLVVWARYAFWARDVFDEKIVVLWNPSIGKAVGITISNSLCPLTVLLVLGSHEFGEVCLPDRLVRSTNGLAVPKVYESLGLFEYYNDGETRFCDVRIMKEGVTKSFTKMLSIKAPDSLVSYRVLELRKNGEVIIENIDDTNSSAIEVYEPSSGHINGIGFYGTSDSFSMKSYMETLLLLDQPNSIIY